MGSEMCIRDRDNTVYCSPAADLEELAAVGRTCAEALVEQAGGALPQFEA